MMKRGTLAIGIVSRNGHPFIEDCLQSLESSVPQLLNHFESIHCILVDSDSSDNTLEVMIGLGNKNKSIKTDVYLIEGDCNAGIARNVILRNSSSDFLFLCDGDIVIDCKFIILAVEKIITNKADAIIGQLSEKWYDSDFKFYKSIPVREKILHEKFVRMTGGIILLSGGVVRSQIEFDDKLKRNEDRDFSLRISERFKILAIPVFVGIHLTQPYYSNERFGTFLKERYNVYLGVLVRKHIYSLSNLLAIVKSEKGVMVGFVYMLLMSISVVLCALEVYVPFYLICSVVLLDLIRYVMKNPLKRFLMNRFISPIMVVEGFLFPAKNKPNYSIVKINKLVKR